MMLELEFILVLVKIDYTWLWLPILTWKITLLTMIIQIMGYRTLNS